jgi:hypothetical protein
MREYALRQFRCVSCGYENDRVIAVMNLYGRGSLILSTTGQMWDSKSPNAQNPRPLGRGVGQKLEIQYLSIEKWTTLIY